VYEIPTPQDPERNSASCGIPRPAARVRPSAHPLIKASLDPIAKASSAWCRKHPSDAIPELLCTAVPAFLIYRKMLSYLPAKACQGVFQKDCLDRTIMATGRSTHHCQNCSSTSSGKEFEHRLQQAGRLEIPVFVSADISVSTAVLHYVRIEIRGANEEGVRGLYQPCQSKDPPVRGSARKQHANRLATNVGVRSVATYTSNPEEKVCFARVDDARIRRSLSCTDDRELSFHPASSFAPTLPVEKERSSNPGASSIIPRPFQSVLRSLAASMLLSRG